MLSKLTDNDAGKQWYKILSDAEYRINNVINKSTEETPTQLLFGIGQNDKWVDEVRAFLKENVNTKKRDLADSRDKAVEKMLKSQEYNKSYKDIGL